MLRDRRRELQPRGADEGRDGDHRVLPAAATRTARLAHADRHLFRDPRRREEFDFLT